MQFEGFEGRDFSAYASPPNLGIISVRYPVRDFDAYRAVLVKRAIEIEREADGIVIGELGAGDLLVDIFAVRDPDGNLTEFYNAR